MTPTEKQLFERLDVIKTKGKCGNKVPSNAASALDALPEVRDKYIDPYNKFLIASPASTSGHFDGGAALRSVAGEMGLTSPELFTATRLSKYCGTTSQILSLTDANLETLTRHMGHGVQVHRA